MTIDKEYSFKSHFVGNVNLKLIGIIDPQNYLSACTYVWYHEKMGYFYGVSNEIENVEDLTSFKKELLVNLMKIIEDNETN